MRTIRISATDARNNFFNLLNQVLYENIKVIIEKVGVKKEAVLQLKPTKNEEDEKTIKLLKKTYGMWKNVPLSRIYDDRIRGKRAKAYLNRLRKGDV